MNMIRNTLIATAAVSALAGSAFAATDSATVTGSIIAPLTLSKTTDVTFGTVARPGSVGTSLITLNPTTNAQTAGAGGAVIVTAGSRGVFAISGDAGRTYSAPSTATINLTSGANTIVFTPTFDVNTGTLGTVPGTAGSFAVGNQTLYAGGSFSVSDTTATGAYSGTLSVTINYQ